ncbi:C40 family peptidase [Kitasatospora sp. NPDC052896]|uniref:C40 family peptidase n=1 Tax=Kitasatospora sp. NPDC052896 TaxID=3364061 RepID=UPI0037CB1ED1
MIRRLLPTLLLALAVAASPLPAPAGALAAPRPVTHGGQRTAAPADDPPSPTTDAISRAQAEADHAATAESAIEAQLTGARTELDQAGRIAEQAVEAYDGARVRLDKAQATALEATAHGSAAEAARAAAAEDAARLAAAMYRSGGVPELSAINALLGTPGPQAAGVQAEAVGQAGNSTRQILDAATSSAAAAAEAGRAARSAAAEATRAADAVEHTKAEAQARVTAQQARVTALAGRREGLLAALAQARHTTVELARQRQEASEALAARQAEKAAKATAAAAVARPAAPPAPAVTDDDRPRNGAAWTERGARAAIAFARSKLGLPYVWGGEGPRGYDCSGLTMLAWAQGGKHLTHFAADQYAESTPVAYRDLRPGDLVFWSHTGKAADIHHVAVYVGDDQIIEAPHTGAVIKQASLWIMGPPDFYARP